ncbi:hypothetical protein FACS189427_06350 [Planctomycetales bacterium]|nr:hypothetical protein FACS189427_06350 [Planctomycetales bacterium]
MSVPQSTEFYDNEKFERKHAENTADGGFTAGYLLTNTFRLEKRIGKGGMGEAWKAHDEVADRDVVIKLIPKEIQHIKEAVDNVKTSFKKVHALQHQHICPVYGIFNDPVHGLYLVMKYIDGVPLDEYKKRVIEKNGSFKFSEALQILWGIAQGLDYAHEKKVIHRDIKPQNIMIDKKDGVQIIDFGLAEEIRTSLVRFSEVQMDVSGTRPYMSPEQWQGKYQDAGTDQYALAVMSYELFSGRFPFYNSDTVILRECVLHEEPDALPNIPEYVNAALLKALSKKREERFENCKAFVKAMATKPRLAEPLAVVADGNTVPEAASANVSVNLPSDGKVSQKWVPPVIQTSLATPSMVSQFSDFEKLAQEGAAVQQGSPHTNGAVKKKELPFRLILTVGATAILVLGLLGLLLMKPAAKPAKTPPVAVAKKQNEKPNEKPKIVQKEEIKPEVHEPVATPNVSTPKDYHPAPLSDEEYKQIREKYPEIVLNGGRGGLPEDSSKITIIVLKELTAEALRNEIAQLKLDQNTLIVVRTTKEHHTITLDGKQICEDDNAAFPLLKLVAWGSEKLTFDARHKSRIFSFGGDNRRGFAFVNIKFINGKPNGAEMLKGSNNEEKQHQRMSGGAVYIRQAAVKFIDCDFLNNQARSGGAAGAFQPAFLFQNCLFENNTLNSEGNGWGSALDVMCVGVVDKSGMKNGAALSLKDCCFKNNKVNKNGGAVILLAWETGITELENVSFIGNDTGALETDNQINDANNPVVSMQNVFAADNGKNSKSVMFKIQNGQKKNVDNNGKEKLRKVFLNHVTIAGNGCGGMEIGGYKDVIITNSLIAANNNFNLRFWGHQENPLKADINHSIIGVNAPGFKENGSPVDNVIVMQSDNQLLPKITLPELRFGAMKTSENGLTAYPLREDSPAVDKGIDDAASPKTDIFGGERVSGKAPDIGAVELQAKSTAERTRQPKAEPKKNLWFNVTCNGRNPQGKIDWTIITSNDSDEKVTNENQVIKIEVLKRGTNNYPFVASYPFAVKAGKEYHFAVKIRANRDAPETNFELRNNKPYFYFVKKQNVTKDWQTFNFVIKSDKDDDEVVLAIGNLFIGATYEIERLDWEQ